jgi:hypothetical protein
MVRPEVRIIDNQQTQQSDVDINSYEANALLAKYGFNQTTSPSYQPAQVEPQQPSKTFEEMVREQELQEQRLMQQRLRDANRPRAITFDDSRGAWTESKWSSSDDENNQFGIQVTIVTDMKF